MPPMRLKLAFTVLVLSPRSTVMPPLPWTDATLNENAPGGPTYGCPRRLKRMRSIASASVTVPTVDRGFAPIRSWSTLIAVVSPSRTSTSGRASVGMKPWTKELYVSLISRCDSAAIVPKTSELLPDPETPVNTVSRRFGIWRLTSLRLFTRAPCTRIQSWLSATCDAGGCSSVFVAMLMGSPSPGRDAGAVSVGARCSTCPAAHRDSIPERSPSRPRTGVGRAGRGSTPYAWDDGQAWAILTRLPAGSRKAQSRAPHGRDAGSCSTSAPDARTFSNVVSRSSEGKIAACSDPWVTSDRRASPSACERPPCGLNRTMSTSRLGEPAVTQQNPAEVQPTAMQVSVTDIP